MSYKNKSTSRAECCSEGGRAEDWARRAVVSRLCRLETSCLQEVSAKEYGAVRATLRPASWAMLNGRHEPASLRLGGEPPCACSRSCLISRRTLSTGTRNAATGR